MVTGVSSGIGQAIAIRLGQEGMNVAVNYVGPPEGAVATHDAIEETSSAAGIEVRSGGAKALLVEADVSSEHDVDQMWKAVTGEFGAVDFLVIMVATG